MDLNVFVGVNTLAQSQTIPIVSISLFATVFQICLEIVLVNFDSRVWNNAINFHSKNGNLLNNHLEQSPRDYKYLGLYD